MHENRFGEYFLYLSSREYNDDNDIDDICTTLLEHLYRYEDYLLADFSTSTLNVDEIKDFKLATILVTILEYFCTENKEIGKTIKLPEWAEDKRLFFDYAEYRSCRNHDEAKAKLFISACRTFRRRNVYFDVSGFERV